jgi:uncharacterized membrane protein YbhN (UPF0104 family)
MRAMRRLATVRRSSRASEHFRPRRRAVTGTVAAPAEEAGARRFRWKRVLIVTISIVVVALLAWLLGWDLRGWFSDLWDTITSISAEYLVAGAIAQTLQTLFKAVAWYWILRYAYPDAAFSGLQILATYAASVALNTFLPANLGTFAMMFMFIAIIAGSNFPGVFTAYLVQKIFFTVAGAAVYLYLFLSVGGSFDIKFSWFHDHQLFTALMLVGIVIVCVIVWRVLKAKAHTFLEKAKEGGEIMRHPKAYFARVFVPQFLGWSAGLGVIAIFLAAYGIPVTFHTVMSVVGGNSLANVTAVTPGSVGVTQAFNVASLKDVTSPDNATAYSVGQQLFTTAWNILVGAVLMIWAFGWTGGKKLVTGSYAEAKAKAAEQSAARKEKKAAKRDEGTREHA